MIFQCCQYDQDRFATNLRRDGHTNNLIWDSAPGQEVLIVQVPFGEETTLKTEDLCETLNAAGYTLNREFEEMPGGLAVCYVSAADKARNNGCRLNAEACSYLVYSVSTDGNVCRIYASPDNQSMIKSYVRIPLEIPVYIQEEIILQGRLRKKEVRTGFYMLSFPPELAAAYTDSGIVYRIEDFEVPVTKEMIQAGTVYVLSPEEPKIETVNPGMTVKVISEAGR